MSNNRKRAPRKEIHEPTTVHVGETTYDAELCDLSDTGAAIEFDLISSNRPGFDIGRPVELDVSENDHQSGRVVRHYVGGFAMAFDETKSESD